MSTIKAERLYRELRLKVTQTDTGASRTAISDAHGPYIFSTLPLGPYLLEASLTDFSPYMQTGIVLQVDSKVTIDIPVKPGGLD